ncbi:MAG: DsbA family protein [Betaproteobacteria bacterium]|nr:DsbA family protein [Betaproteobacteria bacterium]
MVIDHHPHLVYFADPMCSWCWGFSPVLAEIEKEFDLPIHLVLGGLRPGTRTPMNEVDKASIREHWQHVHAMTGRPFEWRFFDRESFVYDTEPACRAIVVMRREGKGLATLHKIQNAFYAENLDVTSAETLSWIASELGMESERFLEAWHSPEAIEETRRDFSLAQGSGVTGFPTLIAGTGTEQPYKLLTRGYQPADGVFQILKRWLAGLTTEN